MARASSRGSDPAFAFTRRVGVLLFAFYAAVYAGFVILNLIAPREMAKPLCFGLDIAVVYGFGLILLAFLMALLYSFLCGWRERATGTGAQ